MQEEFNKNLKKAKQIIDYLDNHVFEDTKAESEFHKGNRLLDACITIINKKEFKLDEISLKSGKIISENCSPEKAIEISPAELEKTPVIIKTSPFKESNKNYDEKMKIIKEKYPAAYEPWTSGLDQKLIKCYREGKTVKELCDIFKRQPGGIRSRLKKLELV